MRRYHDPSPAVAMTSAATEHHHAGKVQVSEVEGPASVSRGGDLLLRCDAPSCAAFIV